MPTYADFYFYKNTPMDSNEVNFFNTGETNTTMKDELLRRLREYQVGEEYNSKVPFNPTAEEIYINAPPVVSVSIEDILSINYMVVKAYDLHNRVTQEYKHFAFFVNSVEPYIQTFPTDGLEDTGVRNAFGYSYRLKIKKDTFVTDFIFSNKTFMLSDLYMDGLRVNVATPIDTINNNMNKIINASYYNLSFHKKENENVSTIIQRVQSQSVIEYNQYSSFKIKLIGDLIAENNQYTAVAVFSASYENIAGLAHPFVCCNLPGGSIATGALTLEQAETIANSFMSVNHAVLENGSPSEQLNIDLKNIYILPYEFIKSAFSSGVGTKYKLEATGVSGGLNINDVYCFQDELEDVIVYSESFVNNDAKWNILEACNVSAVAGRQRISLPQIINNVNFKPNKGFSEFEVKISQNQYGITIKLNIAGKSVDITDEYSLPLSSNASKNVTQENIAKTSSILKGALSIVGGAIATVGGFATGNAAAGVAGLGAIVGGATGAAQTLSQEDPGGTVSVSGGNPDAISALKNGFIYFDIEGAANTVDIINKSQRYGYNFNGMYLKSDFKSIFSVDAKKYNFMYIEANAERVFDANGYIPETFKTWLIERMKNGIRFFYTFDGFFDKSRNQTGYLKA